MRELRVGIDAQEKRDWGSCRTQRVLLRNAVAEFGASAFSVRVGDFWCPNRDYGHEGLTANTGGENWKYVDAICFSLLKDGRAIELTPEKVVASPLNADYHYAFDGGTLVASYYLMDAAAEPTTLSVVYGISGPAAKGRGWRLKVMPLVDIRFMNGQSAPVEHAIALEPKGIRVSRQGKSVAVRCQNAVGAPVGSGRAMEWFYKLGSGERTETAGGTQFIAERRSVIESGVIECEFKRGTAEVLVCCESGKKSRGWEGRKCDFKNSVAKYLLFKKQLEPLRGAAAGQWGQEKAVALEARAYCLANKFAWKAGGGEVLDAGAFWFRQGWLRDAAFALAADAKFFNSTRKRWATQLLSGILNSAVDGVVPSTMGGSPCVDATLLAAIAGFKTGERKPVLAAGELLRQFAKNSSKHGIFVCENGLLSCPPSYGWRDSRLYRRHGDWRLQVPGTLPVEWADAAINNGRNEGHCQELLDSPAYLLDANALWAAAIEAAHAAGVGDGLPHPLDVLQSIRAKFFSNDFLSHIASEEFGPAGIENSSAIQAMALLPHVFSEEEKKRALQTAEEKLFVKRKGKLFGLLSLNSRERVFYGDGQYHGAVAWPRESYYLAKFLLDAGEWQLAGELLEAQLEHQMQEGTVFYSSELFALPEGRNPSAEEETSSDPVPVKNPAQMWSGWVEPYYDFLGVQ